MLWSMGEWDQLLVISCYSFIVVQVTVTDRLVQGTLGHLLAKTVPIHLSDKMRLEYNLAKIKREFIKYWIPFCPTAVS